MTFSHPWLAAGLAASLCVVSSLALNQTNPTTPLVRLPDDPLYLNGSKAKANLTLVLSVETPTVGSTYHSAFRSEQAYVGYFDPMYCYTERSDATAGHHFTPSSAKAAMSSPCGNGTSFDGNFLNWATSSAIDILRYGLTGGHRVLDEGSGEGRTVLERAYLPDGFYAGTGFFPAKSLASNQIDSRTPFGGGIAGDLYIRNCRNRVYFSTIRDTTGNCSQPFGVANAQSGQLLKPGVSAGQPRFYTTRVQVCDSLTASNRLMTFNQEARRWSGLCHRYTDAQGNPYHKPVGQFQVNADNVRVAVFAYLTDNRYGGVMRAPLKYLGERQYDARFNRLSDVNPYQEWDPSTGVLLVNPQSGHPVYPSLDYPRSGVISYVNGFGSLNPDRMGVYRDWDSLSELHYEAFRYLQGKQPTSQGIAGLNGTVANDKTAAENFPVYRTWLDPFAGFQDNQGSGRSCVRNSMLTIADPNTHGDRYLPGNTKEYGDPSRAADTNPALDVQYWTGIVGSFESNGGLTYTGSDGKTHEAFNLPANVPRPELKDIATMATSGSSGSFLIAGLAYFANTQTFRTDLPKARIGTFVIDVNEANSTSGNATLRRGQQLHLAAKYGGFDDTDGTGNPFQGGNNLKWQGADGDARNYFIVDSPQRFLDSITDVFASLAEETGSIAGVATLSPQLRAEAGNAVFQSGFNPVANNWSGRLRKQALRLSESGSAGSVEQSAEWEASEVLTERTRNDHGADRRLIVGPPVGQQGTVAPTEFRWDALASAHRNALSHALNATTSDSLGPARVNYLRGDRLNEISKSNPTGAFRPRDRVLGSVVNAAPVFQGAPSTAGVGTGYETFRAANQHRTPVVFAAANDGMLHALRTDDGRELFAYIPGFVVPHLHALPDPHYAHRPLLDATPAIREAPIHGQWRSVLVGGAGAGAQGVYALDVTDPDSFGPGKVMWEFTDADAPGLGNVLGHPHIARIRVNDAGGGATNTYKWVAIVPGGVNNQRPDGHHQSNAAPSIFLIDLEARPTADAPWTDGSNYWRIELPQRSTEIATGLVELTPILLSDGTLDRIYAGDLQGNVWNIDFGRKGLASLGSNGLANLEALNAMGPNRKPFFLAEYGATSSSPQPITSAPVVARGVNGKSLIVVGTGKYLEIDDTSVPAVPRTSLYALPDAAAPITGRDALSLATINDDGTVSHDAHDPATSKGWYIDFDADQGERQVSPMRLEHGLLFFNTLMPTSGACGDGGGREYVLNVINGRGTYQNSTVGLLGGPFLLELATPAVTTSTTSGRRTATYQLAAGMSGSRGLALGAPTTIALQVGRMSWRQINNQRSVSP